MTQSRLLSCGCEADTVFHTGGRLSRSALRFYSRLLPGEDFMNRQQFFQQLDAQIAKYDLLCHPFYKAWSAGELTRDDLREYAQDYYHHVEAFPTYLAELGIRLDASELRQAVLANMADEKGSEDALGEPSATHSELWLDFAEGM